MLHSAQEVYNYSGIYISYSLSSSSNALKVEPYLITPADSNDHVKVVHMSAYNTTHFGTAVFNNHQNAYIFFNEREAPQLALFTIYLQLPMYDFPHLLKGLYLCLDYNRNPIARRILFIKHSDSTSMDDFLELKGQLIPPRPADRRATPLLQLHLPAGRLHQNLLRPLSPAERERPGTGEADAGNLRQPGQSGNFHFATKLHLLSATFAAENRK